MVELQREKGRRRKKTSKNGRDCCWVKSDEEKKTYCKAPKQKVQSHTIRVFEQVNTQRTYQ